MFIVRARGMYDGCKDIPEMISRVETELRRLREMQRAGATLLIRVQDDYAEIYLPRSADHGSSEDRQGPVRHHA